MPEPQWMIEGLFEKNSLVMLAGPSYSFKSFMALDWLLCMASGRQWLGRYTQPAKVAYILGEGKASLFKRIRAWITYNKLTTQEYARLQENFKVTFNVTQLADSESLDELLDDFKSEDFQPDVIAVDTFARAAVGLDENEAKDIGEWIESADKLRQLGFTVIFLHHTKKNTEFGIQYRGSTALMGAMDTAMTLVRAENYCTLTITKQKDHDEGLPMRFKRVMVPLGPSKESLVLVPVALPSRGPVELGAEWVEVADSKDVPESPSKSVRSQAKALAEGLGITESAARSRLSRKKPKSAPPAPPSDQNAPPPAHPEVLAGE